MCIFEYVTFDKQVLWLMETQPPYFRDNDTYTRTTKL